MNTKKNYYLHKSGSKVFNFVQALKSWKTNTIYLDYTESEIMKFENRKVDHRFHNFKDNSPMTRIGLMCHEDW